jgi:predicted O-linked N-acetylglucosamine transferase (SPINDLY family)
MFLDTLPFNAGTTASDALWAGVPVLTCAGAAYAARMAGSLLRAAGCPELITDDLGRYEQRALELSDSGSELEELRARLARTARDGPLFDTGRFTRHLEAAYRDIWKRHLLGLGPASIRVGL